MDLIMSDTCFGQSEGRSVVWPKARNLSGGAV